MPASCPSLDEAGLRLQRWPPARLGAVLTSVKYANQRRLASRIGAYQAIGFKIARMEARPCCPHSVL